MRVDTSRFGEMDVPEEAILTFADGLYGFPGVRDCCLLPYRTGSVLRWLQCLNDPGIAFLTVEPHAFFPDYDIDLAEADAAGLELESAADAAVVTLVTVLHDGRAMATNLAAPIVINTATRRAKQVILDDDRYVTRHVLATSSFGIENPETPDRLGTEDPETPPATSGFGIGKPETPARETPDRRNECEDGGADNACVDQKTG
jgi:flagellar assembly factor FliW